METSKIIAHIWDRYQNMTEEERKAWDHELRKRLIEDELEQIEEQSLKKEQEKGNESPSIRRIT